MPEIERKRMFRNDQDRDDFLGGWAGLPEGEHDLATRPGVAGDSRFRHANRPGSFGYGDGETSDGLCGYVSFVVDFQLVSDFYPADLLFCPPIWE